MRRSPLRFATCKIAQLISPMLKRLLYNFGLAKFILKILLRINNWLYLYTTKFAIISENGVHPKHRIIRYEDWFLNEIQAGSTVVDIGSNTGGLSRHLAAKANAVIGIEIEKDLHSVAKRKALGNTSYHNADATTFDYRSVGTIDFFVLSNVLEHIENRIDFLSKLVTVSKAYKNSKFLIRVPAFDRDWITPLKAELGIYWKLDPTHFTEYTMDSLRHEITSSGLIITTSTCRFGEYFLVCRAA